MTKTLTLHELFTRDEDERLAATRAEMAAEKAAWDTLPQAEKDRIIAAQDEFWVDFDNACSDGETEDEDDEDSED